MAITPIDQVRNLIGDTPASPFYPQLSDEQIQGFLDLTGGNILAAARYAAISISMTIASYNTREKAGNIEVWNEYARNYLDALKNLISNPGNIIPGGLMPWSANKGCGNKLLSIELCDGDDSCATPCGCDSTGDRF